MREFRTSGSVGAPVEQSPGLPDHLPVPGAPRCWCTSPSTTSPPAEAAWAGEVMDEAMAIEGLLQSDGVVLGAGSSPP